MDRTKRREFIRDIIDLALGFSPVGDIVAVGKFLMKWTKELINYVNN